MNQLCKVCGEPAAGYHFGAFTCEGCKSFFGRTYNNLSALGDCKNNGECVINKKNRTSCKSCRLKKCLMVGMSKSGSRYGRRSNWFKIHCLIQDQQEMSNRMSEVHKNGDEMNAKLGESKDFITKYKENEMRNSAHANLAELNSRISPRLNSPNSSEGSMGRSVSSPYSTLFEGAKVPAFPSPYLTASANLGPSDFQKEFTNLANRFNPAALPLTPISPLSPLNAAVSRLFLQNTSAILGKRFNELQKLQSEQLLASRFLPLQATLNNVLKPTSKDLVEEMTNGMRECYGDLPEQDGPIDLSKKRIHDFSELTLTTETKCPKAVPGDHDSGFSPSSNEDNHNTSPLDLTAKRQCLSLNNISVDDHVDVEDEDETSDVEVQDDESMDTDRQDARHEIECAP